MNNGEKIFQAEALSVAETFIDKKGGRVGFRVPEYQRTYDWSKENLGRLIENCLSGFHQLSQTKGARKPHTFLGTIILVNEKESVESGFQGESYALVDGQQRITSLILICCVLYEKLTQHQYDAENSEYLSNECKEWLAEEVNERKDSLFQCTTGLLNTSGAKRGSFDYFPRVVRKKDDSRARKNKEYKSSIAKLLKLFEDFSQQDEYSNFEPDSSLPQSNESKRLLENFKILRDLGKFLCDEKLSNFSNDFDYYLVKREIFKLSQMQNLFLNRPKPNCISKICDEPNVQGIVRLLLFSAYLLNYVVLNCIETSDEDSAFDLFDALNTTGEPLTAIETLKPLVVESGSNSGFEGSKSAIEYERIENNLNDVFDKTEERQSETKQLLTSFALYFDGDKLPLELSGQRNYLRRNYKKINSTSEKLRFVQAIADIAEFRYNFWISKDRIAKILEFNSAENKKWIELCLALLRDMKTKLTVPIIARFWSAYKNSHGEEVSEEELVCAIKALTAFVVIRRAYTGGTQGIDSEFRQLMRDKILEIEPLCLGLNFKNKVWSIQQLKKRLMNNLCGLIDVDPDDYIELKSSWIGKAKNQDLYKHSNHLCRFLLLAATDNAELNDSPGLLKKSGVLSYTTSVFFNIDRWNDENLKTVEHIAPQEFPKSSTTDWKEEIYVDRGVQHTIGNLTLLPGKSNTSISNRNWNDKRTYYRIFADRNKIKRNANIEKAKQKGIDINQSTLRLIDETPHLQILESVVNVDTWTKDLIEARSQNILELGWETISGWLLI